ncbi:MAG: hypothetical protein KBT39_07225 [Bacteroidales bacterium]|nr:hypothetical protein [Bacteroidales bacterium]
MKTMILKSMMLVALMSVSTMMCAKTSTTVNNDKRMEMCIDMQRHGGPRGGEVRHPAPRPGHHHDMGPRHSRECMRKMHHNRSHRRCDCMCHVHRRPAPRRH